jgi:hypothetical protein
MHAPAATASSALHIATCSTRTQAPAASASLAAGQQLQSPCHSDLCLCGHDILSITPCKPLDSDTRPGGYGVHGSGATTSIFAILGCMPLRPLRPQHSTLQPACLGCRPQRLLRLQQRSNSLNLCVTRLYVLVATTSSALLSASSLTRTLPHRRTLCPRQHGVSFNLCDIRMRAPAALLPRHCTLQPA